MKYQELMHELSHSFGIKNNEVLIVQALIGRELTADQICAITGIPKGRVYDFINRLLRLKLIKIGRAHV